MARLFTQIVETCIEKVCDCLNQLLDTLSRGYQGHSNLLGFKLVYDVCALGVSAVSHDQTYSRWILRLPSFARDFFFPYPRKVSIRTTRPCFVQKFVEDGPVKKR